MLHGNGTPKEGIYDTDQLHMNMEGYALWTGVLRKALSDEVAHE